MNLTEDIFVGVVVFLCFLVIFVTLLVVTIYGTRKEHEREMERINLRRFELEIEREKGEKHGRER